MLVTKKFADQVSFCDSISNAIFDEARRNDVTPLNVLNRVREVVINKLRCIDKANPDKRSDMIDAVAYAATMCRPSFHIYAEGEWGQKPSYNCPELDKIIFSGNRTIVFWKDGTKTVVKCGKGEEFDEYSGFVAAFAKKAFGSTHHVKKMISRAKVSQAKKNKKDKTDGNI